MNNGRFLSCITIINNSKFILFSGLEYHTSLPESGWNRDKIVSEVETLLGLGDYKALSGICHKPEDKTRTEVITHIYTMTAYTNPLNPDAFPGVRKMEV